MWLGFAFLLVTPQYTWLSEAGSCAVVAIIYKRHIIVASVGDSRAFLCRKGKVVDIAQLHKPRGAEQIRVEEAGGVVKNGYFLNTIAVTRAFGDVWLKKLDRGFISEPSVSILEIDEDDEFLLLASDGVTESGSGIENPQRLVNEVREQLMTGKDLGSTVQWLLEKVCKACSRSTDPQTAHSVIVVACLFLCISIPPSSTLLHPLLNPPFFPLLPALQRIRGRDNCSVVLAGLNQSRDFLRKLVSQRMATEGEETSDGLLRGMQRTLDRGLTMKVLSQHSRTFKSNDLAEVKEELAAEYSPSASRKQRRSSSSSTTSTSSGSSSDGSSSEDSESTTSESSASSLASPTNAGSVAMDNKERKPDVATPSSIRHSVTPSTIEPQIAASQDGNDGDASIENDDKDDARDSPQHLSIKGTDDDSVHGNEEKRDNDSDTDLYGEGHEYTVEDANPVMEGEASVLNHHGALSPPPLVSAST